jgi:hypothetical protein
MDQGRLQALCVGVNKRIDMTVYLRSLLSAISLLLCLIGCATPSGLVLHELEYEGVPNLKNKPDTEILAFRFGSPGDKAFALDLATYEYPTGRIPQRGGIGGYLKVRTSIWVKWKSLADGQVHEATAEFAKKLPKDMTDCRIFFTTYSNRLTVYLVTTERGDSFTDPDRMPIQAQYFKTFVLFESGPNG